jgi:hypothetical protein
MVTKWIGAAAATAVVAVAIWGGDARAESADEGKFYPIHTFKLPETGTAIEPGAIERMPDGRIAVSTRLGEIWMIDRAYGRPPADAKFTRFASGLHEVLGLAYRDGWLYCAQRCEVTRMKDVDGDGRADVFETVNDDWGINGDYHEYCFGSKFDRDGYMWIALCLTGSFTSENPYRGWCLRISADGKMIPTCSGLRSPGGIGMNAEGDMFFTDNQGPWNGACALKHLAPGDFEGNPSGNGWYSLTDALGPRPPDPKSGSRMYIEAKKIPQLKPPAVLFPYEKMGQSASGFACDTTGGKFGPFKNQLFVGDQTHSTVMRVCMEKVRGRYQGACFMFRRGFDSGNLALLLSPEGTLFVGGTGRGWGARGGKEYALQSMVWNGVTPFEILEMKAKPDGFNLTFTQPVDAASLQKADSTKIETYTYIYQASYGSPEVDRTFPAIERVEVASDGLSARLYIKGLVPGHIHELHFPGVKSSGGERLLHDAAYYTLNDLPEN